MNTNIVTMGSKLINTDSNENNAMAGALAFTPSELTIASGAITATRSHHTVDTQSDDGTDDLDTIATGSVADFTILLIRAANTARTIVCKHTAGGAGQLHNADDADFSLDDSDKSITYQRRGADWYEKGRDDITGIVQTAYTSTGAVATGTTVIPNDDTIPQKTEGDEYMTLAITPKNTNNKLLIEAEGHFASSNTDQHMVMALFQNATNDALAVVIGGASASNVAATVSLRHEMTAGTVSAITFKIRAGQNGAATTTFNGESGARIYGGILLSHIRITEIRP